LGGGVEMGKGGGQLAAPFVVIGKRRLGNFHIRRRGEEAVLFGHPLHAVVVYAGCVQ